MCATVCPSQALAYVPPERIARQRPRTPTNDFRFGNEHVTTKVFMMAPAVDAGDRRRRRATTWREEPDGPEGWIVDDAGLG